MSMSERAEQHILIQREAAELIAHYTWTPIPNDNFDSRLIDNILYTPVTLSPGEKSDFYLDGENYHIHAHPEKKLLLIGKKFILQA